MRKLEGDFHINVRRNNDSPAEFITEKEQIARRIYCSSILYHSRILVKLDIHCSSRYIS